MNVYDVYATDEKEEKDGKWFDIPGMRIKLALADESNSLYQKAVLEVAKGIADDISEEEERNSWCKIYAKAVVKDAEVEVDGKLEKGILLLIDNEVKLVECNEDNVTKLLMDLPHLFKVVRNKAMSWSSFRKEVEKKNLKK